ncbi:hypothetical protein RhiirA1_536642 [Rhizophagus irregularis]|uniref:Uncharacterized protein n=1 Tax=Rhizophagus irregularis TaxID=588596 RepID=A0A2N0RP05_9GLOM|nr:hypothetical protein RhiirA1_536642 [Rhizophagus irregularis]
MSLQNQSTTGQKAHRHDTPPLTPPPTPSKSKKIDKNDGNFDIRNMFFILIFCGSLVVFLGALSGLEIIDEKDDEFLQISDEIHHVNNDNDDVVNNNDGIDNHEENENVDFIENTATNIENVNPELIIKEEKEKEDIIYDIEDEGLDPIPLNNDGVSNSNDENKLDQDDKDITFNITYCKTHFTYDDVVGSLTDEERDDINKTQLLEMNTNESSDSSCGTWQYNYSMLHEKILSGNEAQRYASYICDDKNNCGGLSDRILGMTSAFFTKVMISLNPSSNIRELETSEINVIDFDAKNLDQQFMLSNWTTKYPSPFIKFYSNRGMIIRSFDSKYYSQSLKDMGLRPHTTFGCVVDYLFRPAPSALSFITQYTSLFALPIIYYLVTDSSELRNKAVQKFEHFVVSELPANSNLDNLHNPDNVINAMIESWIFSKTDYRIISSGIMYCLEYFYSGIEELSKSYNECLEMNINLDEEFEESMQKNEEDELSDDTDEFRNNNTIDGLTKAILEFSEKTSKIQTHPVFQDITNIII